MNVNQPVESMYTEPGERYSPPLAPECPTAGEKAKRMCSLLTSFFSRSNRALSHQCPPSQRPGNMPAQPQQGVKRRRVTQACDYCHQRSIRCQVDPNDEEGRCTNCIAFAQSCERLRPAKKRGVKPRTLEATTIQNDEHELHAIRPAIPSTLGYNSSLRAPASQGLIVDLVDVYFATAYNIFPWVCAKSFRPHCEELGRRSRQD